MSLDIPQIMSLQLAVATEDLGTELKKAIGVAASFRIEGIRLNSRSELNAVESSESALRQTLLYVKERQMLVAGLLCPTRHALYDQQYIEPRMDVIRKSMSLVRKLETSEVLIRSGRIPNPDAKPETPSKIIPDVNSQANPFSFASAPPPSGPSDVAKFAMLSEILNDLTQHGNHVGCVLNLQVSSYDKPLISKLMSSVKSGPLKITFDPATAVMTGANVTQTYRDLYQQVGYIRARDAITDVDGAGVEVAVGDGVVDWVELLPTLLESDFRGWICVERTGGDNKKDDVERGVSYLKSLIPPTGN